MDNQGPKTDHDILTELSTMLKYLVRQVELISTSMNDKVDKSVAQDHETRIRKVESWQENAIGRNAILSAGIALIVTILGAFIKGKF
jgi:hypothetical protein